MPKLIVSQKGSLKQVAKVPEKLREAFKVWLKGDVATQSNYVRFNAKGNPMISNLPIKGYEWFHRRDLKVVEK